MKTGMESYADANKGMSPRKAMASKPDGGNFGIESFEKMNAGGGAHPDAAAGLGSAGSMADHERAIGEPVHHTKGHLPAQAHPDHGPTHPGGHGHNAHNAKY